MNEITLLSLVGIAYIFILAEISDLKFKIHSDKFYNFFHFSGGFVSCLFFFSITANIFLSLLFVLTTGILWEVYEWVDWKFFRRNKLYKPKKEDTLEDLILDVLGALSMLIVLFMVGRM